MSRPRISFELPTSLTSAPTRGSCILLSLSICFRGVSLDSWCRGAPIPTCRCKPCSLSSIANNQLPGDGWPSSGANQRPKSTCIPIRAHSSPAMSGRSSLSSTIWSLARAVAGIVGTTRWLKASLICWNANASDARNTKPAKKLGATYLTTSSFSITRGANT
jgi:hypothetical protein